MVEDLAGKAEWIKHRVNAPGRAKGARCPPRLRSGESLAYAHLSSEHSERGVCIDLVQHIHRIWRWFLNGIAQYGAMHAAALDTDITEEPGERPPSERPDVSP